MLKGKRLRLRETFRAGRWLTSRATSSFITTPIFYVNAAPHIGHLYSALLADVAHRWRLIKGVEPAVFSTGTDEHGLKIQKAAAAQNKAPIALCNEVSSKFKTMFDRAGISYTHYIRTTDTQHIKKVEEFWRSLCAGGHIYKDSYSGWYCVSDEAFLADDQVADSPELGSKVSLESGHPVEWGSEENYIFRLSSFRDQLLDWATMPPYPIVPEFARRLVVGWLQAGLSDLSVSRPLARLKWGVPVPDDPSQTIYVWLDALVNYLTVSGHPLPGHVWPATEHVVGKDILRFHAIFWPAFLLAAGLQLPRRILTHSHWIVHNTKMSKSRGNVIDPLKQFSYFGEEAVRYYLLKEGYLHHDGDYSMERLVSVVNSDLANTLGNLLQRISSKRLAVGGGSEGCGLHYHQELFPFSSGQHSDTARSFVEDHTLIESLQNLPGVVDSCYEDFRFSAGLEEVMRCLHHTNQFVQRWAPWHLIKDPAQHPTLQTVLLVAMESVRLCGCLLHPVLPQLSSQLLAHLGASPTPTRDDLHCKLSENEVGELERLSRNLHSHDGKPLFTKIELP